MSNLPWLGFLERALWGLEQAAARLREAEVRAEFEATTDWWRNPIKTGALKGTRVPEETAVSGALEMLFERLAADQLISGISGDEADLRQFSFVTEKRRVFDPAIGKKIKPTDIAIILRASEKFDLRIEAKTLISEKDVLSEYLSERGLLRFEDASNPYTIEPFGGMVAYIVRDPTRLWEERVRTNLLTKFGNERIRRAEIGTRLMTTSRHSFVLTEKSGTRMIEVDVLHMAVEIDAKPSLRATTHSTAP